MPDNFYELLGVADDASREEIKRAYRHMVREYHPDVNPDDRATDQFRQIRRAYETLTDPERRKAYDRLGHREYVETRLGTGSDEEADDPEPDPEPRGTDATESAHASRTNSANTGGSPRSGGSPGRSRAHRSGRRQRRTRPRQTSTAPTDRRTPRERARARRQMQRRRLISRWGEPTLAFATLWAFLAYVVGVAWYLRANRQSIGATIGDIVASPFSAPATLSNGGPIQSGVEFAAQSATGTTAGLFFPVGGALLAITLLATVIRHPPRWRHPGWWAVPLLGVGPLAGFLVQTLTPGMIGTMIVAVAAYGLAPVGALVGWLGFLSSRL